MTESFPGEPGGEEIPGASTELVLTDEPVLEAAVVPGPVIDHPPEDRPEPPPLAPGLNLHSNASGEYVKIDGAIPGWRVANGSTFLYALATSALYPTHGSRSFRITAVGTQRDIFFEAEIADMPRVTAGDVLSTSAEVTSGGVERVCQVRIKWFDAADVLVSVVSGLEYEESEVAGEPVQVTLEGAVAPADAVKATASVRVNSVVPGEYHYVDEIMLNRGETVGGFAEKDTDVLPSTPSQIAVDYLSAISADMGTLTAGQIIGGAFRSAVVGVNPRFDLTASGLFFKGPSGAEVFALDATTGAARFKGSIEVGATVPASTISTPGGLADINTNAGLITAGTFRGPTFETALANPRVRMVGGGSGGLYAYDSGSVETFGIDAATGAARFKGSIDVGSSLPTIGGANFLKDPSFEEQTGAAGTAIGGVHGNVAGTTFTNQTSGGRTGGRFGRLTATTAMVNPRVHIALNGRAGVEPGRAVIVSAYVRRGAANTITRCNVQPFFFRADGTVTGTTDFTVLGGVPSATGSAWARVWGRYVPPADAVTTRFNIGLGDGTETVPLNQTLDIDDCQIEEGEIPTAFTPMGGQDGGVVSAGLFRGSIFESSATNPKVRHDTTGLFITDAAGLKPLQISSTGLDLLASENFYVPARAIRWFKGSARIGDVWASAAVSPAYDSIEMNAYCQGVGRSEAFATVSAIDDLGSYRAQVSSHYYPSAVAGVGTSNVVAWTNTSGFKVVIDSNSKSDFLQLASTARLALAHGSDSITLSSARAGTKVINHGLGRTPLRVFVTPSNSAYATAAATYTSTQFTAAVNQVDGTLVTNTIPFDWIAIG